MIDVAAGETDDIGNQPVLIVQRMIGFFIDEGLSMPAKGFQRLFDELPGLCGGELPFLFIKRNQFTTAWGEDIAPERICAARLRNASLAISSRRRSEVKIRNGLRASAASSTGRNAVE